MPHLAVDRCPTSTFTDRSCLSWNPSCFPNLATVSPRSHTYALEPSYACYVIDASNRLSIDATSSCSPTQGAGSYRQPSADLWQGAHVLTCNSFAPSQVFLFPLYSYISSHLRYPTHCPVLLRTYPISNNNSHGSKSDVRQLDQPAKWPLQFVQ